MDRFCNRTSSMAASGPDTRLHTWLLAQTTQKSGLVLKLNGDGQSSEGDVVASAADGICDDTEAIAVTKGCGGVTECDPGFELMPLFGAGVGNCWCCGCCGCGC